ncbi:RHS repeat domain-containing protein [Xanthomonas euroxanthea]|uniref:RHS repeat domain-containing protein n=1 Tax=Xanthomonas euroxanthea TaxID=2259622 RepID=UPI00161B3013|nr:RHS repeat-associated core domain-containing protein [Xanthomonas euroxanthea]MBB5767285.1 RHS repeat-associated protein [Xanthomonas euroxanthea]
MLRFLYTLCGWMLLSSAVHAQEANPYVWVQLDAPSAGTTLTAPASILVSASAGTIDDGVSVSSITLYQNGGVIASVNGQESVSFVVDGAQAGTHQFSARATSNRGGTATTPITAVTVVAAGDNPPSISLNDANGAPFFAPATVGLSANASDSDGSVTQVEYFANGAAIGSSGTAPYAIAWAEAPVGNHSITARATDNNGKQATSAPLTVTVEQSVIVGNIEAVASGEGSTYLITGWACSTGRNASIDVHAYLGGPSGSGSFFAASTANQASEAGVASTCRAQGAAYRFSIPLDAAARQRYANQLIYIHGISPVGAASDLISNSGTFRVPPPVSIARRYVYDEYQRLCKTIEPETGATVVDYDAAGNISWTASGLSLPDAQSCNREEALASGRVVLRTYDVRNRLSWLSFPDSNGDQRWTYTPDGLPARIETTTTDGGGNTVVNTYEYNRRRLLTSEGTAGWTSWSVGYSYDANGALASQLYPSSLSVDYAPNALGQPTRVGSYATGISYHPNGAIAQFSYGNGVVHSMAMNARQLPAMVSDSGAQQYQYQYDANGNVSTILDQTLGDAYSRTMEYDARDRLRVAASPSFGGSGAHRYTYDAQDNLRTHVTGDTSYEYYYDGANRLTNLMNVATGASVVGLSYDVQGNLSNKNGQAYTFSQGNRLRSVANKEWYAYDGYGRRVIACGSAACNYQLYSQLGQLLYTQDARNGINTDYIYLAGSVVALRTRPAAGGAETVTYQHTDALGSPVATTNAAGEVVERTHYEPYGAAIGKTVDGVGYTGHAMDGGTGLIYMQQRYYDPTIPRFLSVDPIAANADSGAGFNRYAYAAENPFRFIDPDGREEREPKDSRSLASHSSNLGRMTTSTRSFASVLGQRAKTPSSQARLIESVGGDVNVLAQARSTHEEFVGAIIGLATGGGLGSGTRTTSLFRAVGPDELADIKAMSAFRNLGSAEGKYFTTSASEASAYAKQAVKAFGDQPYTIVSTKVPTSIFKGLSPVTVDRGIPAWVIPTERLPGLVPRIMNNSPLPPTGF